VEKECKWNKKGLEILKQQRKTKKKERFNFKKLRFGVKCNLENEEFIMKYLYVDNFRGFQDTLIPIKKVNFLIGENSTGKTSILSLINLFSLNRFWQQYEFNTDQVDLGNFKNIVNMESKDRNYFKIGFIVTESSNKNQNKAIFTLLTFTGENDLPFLSHFNYLDNQVEMEFKFSGKFYEYRVKKAQNISNIDFSPQKVLEKIKNWEKNNGKEKFKPLEEFPISEQNRTAIPIDILMPLAISKEAKSKEFLGTITPFSYKIVKAIEPFVWIAPIRSKPRRTYDRFKITFSPEGEHSPYLIKELLSNEKTGSQFLKFIEGFGIESNLLNSVKINPFGNDPSSPFELMVRLNEKLINICYVGYGISQCLPLLVEIFSREKGAWYAIQQPEVHLHPKAQAALGSLIYNLALSENKNFLIETHSDYIIDRFRLNYRRNPKEKIDSQVLYFERTQEGNRVYPIDIEENGNYRDNQPKSFREFFIKEQMDLLALD